MAIENQSEVLGQRQSGAGPRTPLGQGIKSGQINPATFGTIAAATTVTTTAALVGAKVGNTITICPAAALPTGIVIAAARVSAADVVSVTLANVTGAGVVTGLQVFDYNLQA